MIVKIGESGELWIWLVCHLRSLKSSFRTLLLLKYNGSKIEVGLDLHLRFPRNQIVHDRRRHDVHGLQRGPLDISDNGRSHIRVKLGIYCCFFLESG